jgi:hypothetical protein
VTEHAYRRLAPSNFSKDLLEVFAAQRRRLSVIPVNGVLWSDWGSVAHIVDTLRTIGRLDRLGGTVATLSPTVKANGGYRGATCLPGIFDSSQMARVTRPHG